jgi:hypothetical protein
MRHFEPEPRALMPLDFLDWYHEIGMLADAEGEAAMLGLVMRFAPVSCVRYLASQQPLLAELISRGRYTDWMRFQAGVQTGRGAGL